MTTHDKKIQKLIDKYVELSNWIRCHHFDHLNVKASDHNRKMRKQTDTYLELFHMGKPGIKVLYDLLEHPSPYVRLDTAIFLIPRFTEKCLKIYEELMNLDNPAQGKDIEQVKIAAELNNNRWKECGFSLSDMDPLWEQYKDEDFSDFE